MQKGQFMRIRCKPWARPELEACDFYISNPDEFKGNWREQFADKDAPLFLELGCGKGGFISQAFCADKSKNYIAVDIKNEMLVLAKRKIEEQMKAHETGSENVRIFIKNIMLIDNVFDESDGIDRIFINFCNPWPKPKHKKRRLTHLRQLLQYKKFLKGDIWFKTDDDQLFKESLTYFDEAGFDVVYTAYDLHNSEYSSQSYVTEHEKMFSEQGIKIKFLIAKKRK